MNLLTFSAKLRLLIIFENVAKCLFNYKQEAQEVDIALLIPSNLNDQSEFKYLTQVTWSISESTRLN